MLSIKATLIFLLIMKLILNFRVDVESSMSFRASKWHIFFGFVKYIHSPETANLSVVINNNDNNTKIIAVNGKISSPFTRCRINK